MVCPFFCFKFAMLRQLFVFYSFQNSIPFNILTNIKKYTIFIATSLYMYKMLIHGVLRGYRG